MTENEENFYLSITIENLNYCGSNMCCFFMCSNVCCLLVILINFFVYYILGKNTRICVFEMRFVNRLSIFLLNKHFWPRNITHSKNKIFLYGTERF